MPTLAEYMEEIRKQVCSRCIERPPGGPPCMPLGKLCGIEMHLEEYVAAIHKESSPFVSPYLERNRQEVCSKCPLLHSSSCPCPMEYLIVPLIEAIETVDQRHAEQLQPTGPVPPVAPIAG